MKAPAAPAAPFSARTSTCRDAAADMSERWREVFASDRHRIVAFDRDVDSDASTHHAVMTFDGAVLRRDLSLTEARIWLEHFTRRDARAHPPARAPRRAR